LGAWAKLEVPGNPVALLHGMTYAVPHIGCA